MKHICLKQLFTALLMLCTTVATAHDFEVGGIYYNILSEEDKTVEVIYKGEDSYDYSNEYTGSVVIPECVTYSGTTYIVTGIGIEAFFDCFGLTSIELPNSVTSIEDMAFSRCSGLTSIFIPEGVSSIGLWAFVDCNNLDTITVDENNTTYDSRENGNAIIETNSNKLILGCATTVIPESVTTIGNAAFCGCTGLVNITIPENVSCIEEGAFVDCTSLNTVVMLSKDLSSIGSEAFANCDKLSDIYCHSTSVPSTENDAFNDSYPENITLHVPANAIDDYKGVEPWSNFGTIVAIVEPTLGKCVTPAISYINGQITLTCETEEVKYVTNVVTENELNYHEMIFEFVPTYTFNAYATKDKYENSDVATITLCWIPCTENHDSTGIVNILSKPILIQSNEGIITLRGLTEGIKVVVYDTLGHEIASSIADNGTAIIDTNLTAGSVAIVKIGGKSIKIVVK